MIKVIKVNEMAIVRPETSEEPYFGLEKEPFRSGKGLSRKYRIGGRWIPLVYTNNEKFNTKIKIYDADENNKDENGLYHIRIDYASCYLDKDIKGLKNAIDFGRQFINDLEECGYGMYADELRNYNFKNIYFGLYDEIEPFEESFDSYDKDYFICGLNPLMYNDVNQRADEFPDGDSLCVAIHGVESNVVDNEYYLYASYEDTDSNYYEFDTEVKGLKNALDTGKKNYQRCKKYEICR